MRLLPVRYFLSAILLAAATAISLVNAVSITIPPLSQCEPAEFLVQAQGNYTIDIRDALRMNLVLRVRYPASQTNFTWPAVELDSGSTAIVIVTDKTGPRREDVVQTIATAPVGASPSNDSRCTKPARDRENHRTRGIEIPLVAGILGGILFILICLIILTMLRRRSERYGAPDKDEERERTSVAGGGYMAKLVPGLQIAPPPPQPQPPRRQRRRRGFRTHRRREDEELPSYGESQRQPPKYQPEAFELPQRWSDPDASSSTTRLFDADRIEPVQGHEQHPNRI